MKYLIVCLSILLLIVTGCKREDVPAVETVEVSSITRTTATCGGEILSQGDSEITERGICWSTSDKPTILDNKKIDKSGNNFYTIDLTGLDPDTEYFVRAYATNSFGTGYGDTKFFTTEPATIPEVITYSRISVTQSTAKLYGEVISDGESQLLDYGFCWSTSDNPTVSDNCKTPDSDYGYYIATIPNLKPGTKYYASAYATNRVGTAYGEIVSFNTCSEIPDTSFIGNWHSVSDPNCGYLPQSIQGKKRLEITADSIFTMYNLSGEFFFSSSFKIKPNDEDYDTIYFINPQPYPYHLIELTDCNNLILHNPLIWDIAGGCDHYTRIE